MRGVLFDFDGTLADTMQSHYEAWRVSLNNIGIKIEKNDYYPLEGMSMHSIAKILSEKIKLTASEINQLVLDKKKYFIASEECKLYAGVESLIEKLNSKGIPIGIVTSSHSEQLFLKFDRTFLSRFQAIVTGDEVQYGKPHPQPYLMGAIKLNLDPHQCLAVENAPLGVSSAKSAGMYCIGVSTTVSPDQLSKADEVIRCIDEIELSKGFKGMYKNYE